jgi:hypothetical protein
MVVESIQPPKPFQAEYEGSIPFTRSNDLGCPTITPSGKQNIVDIVTLWINDRFGWGAARLNQHGETSPLARAVRPTAPQGS